MDRRINFKILNTCAGTLCIITNGVNLANENHVGWSIAGIYAGIFCIATTQWARQAMANTLRKIADILCAPLIGYTDWLKTARQQERIAELEAALKWASMHLDERFLAAICADEKNPVRDALADADTSIELPPNSKLKHAGQGGVDCK